MNTQSTTDAVTLAQGGQQAAAKRRRNHRGGKKKNRRPSFAGEDPANVDGPRSNQHSLEPPASGAPRPPFYKLGQSNGGNLSDTSLDSQALLDHR